jgi:hypothetical protein
MLIKSLKCALAAVLALAGVSDVLAHQKKSAPSKEGKKAKKKANTSTSAPSTSAPSTVPTRSCLGRTLSNVDERQLFALLDGEELKKQLDAVYGENGGPETEHYQSRDQLSSDLDPFVAPSYKGATLLAADPGLWTVDNFFTEKEADSLIALMKKNGYDKGMFGPCTDKTISNHATYPSDTKFCYQISAETMCEGPYQISACTTKTDPEDGAFITTLLARFNALWSTETKIFPYIRFQHSSGGAPPMYNHHDRRFISMIVYLSDGGAATLFPNIGISIVPKKGMVATWLNMDKEGNRNHNADHAVQAHPMIAGERSIVIISFEESAFEEFASIASSGAAGAAMGHDLS